MFLLEWIKREKEKLYLFIKFKKNNNKQRGNTYKYYNNFKN